MATQPEFDFDAYMAWEENQPELHEYLAGEVFAMSGGTDAHYTILGNAYAGLRAALAGKPCRAFVSGMKLRIERADAAFYPEAVGAASGGRGRHRPAGKRRGRAGARWAVRGRRAVSRLKT